MGEEDIAFEARIERHRDDLPAFVLLPPEAVAQFAPEATFSVDVWGEDAPLGRRAVKAWGDGRWFFDLTLAQLKAMGCGPGATAPFRLKRAPDTPQELAAALSAAGLDAAWRKLARGVRRQAAESVFDAKRPETKRARIERVLAQVRKAQE